ncbi:chymotrypsinogen B [Magallana gigas]|uniref:chymotrypsinogen B n=1 Tax=Magallana gigas TaxID=29159 RepID=UPI00333F7550
MADSLFKGCFGMFISFLHLINEVSGRAVQPPTRQLIIGGTSADRWAWPWQAGIMVADQLICGGTLIQYDIVLTAAHCLMGRSKDSYKVVLGDYDRTVQEGGEQFIEVSAFETHPKFEGNFLSGYDVGIIHLVRNASLSESVGVIRTAEPGMVTPKLSKARCLITGWGVNSLATGDEELATQLQEADIEIISNKRCNSKRYWDGLVKRTNICAMYKGTAACQGDSGSPLVCCWGGSYILVGVTSWGSSTCKNYPSVYTDVSTISPWITSTVTALRNHHCTENTNSPDVPVKLY